MINKFKSVLGIGQSVEKIPVFNSYHDVSSAGADYNSADIASIVAEKTKWLADNISEHDKRPHENQAIESIKRALGTTSISRVVDWGGGCGALNLLFVDQYDEELDWTIIETEAMIKAAHAFDLDNFIEFKNSYDLLDTQDNSMIVAQGVWQYLPDPIEMLNNWLNSDSKSIYFGRTAFLRGEKKVVSYQKTWLHDHGPVSMPISSQNRQCLQPITYVPLELFMDIVNRSAFFIDRMFDEDTVMIQTQIGRLHIEYKGFLLIKK
jgi:putative methyltransferase (TIGR04325 family)